ncbi:MAG: hypothetical protein EOP47_10655 [Sphingobacteriaceae bacterium]|nr:MAG: hypothetical protein EOP47_10655 [Sphingobacteriaceae bacterium]
MKALQNLLGGLAGAVALNIVHQTAKAIDHDAPRVDLIGEEAVSKGLKQIGVEPPKGNKLFAATLAGDLISNAIYYSAIGLGKNSNLLFRGAAYGLSAGLGALTLPQPMGLSDAPVTKTQQTKAMTVAWYLLGGVVTALTIKALRK